ncbi:MAG TPA: polyprenyl synthetase family protein, partial [Candidatus Thermoplasmatota archaeon]|nr:polyprenyl synthetase family protein [Candidatus Thermoplasmatota archaeon]
ALGDPDATDAQVQEAVAVMGATGALARGEALRDRWAGHARDALARLPPSPARDALRALNDWALTRGF